MRTIALVLSTTWMTALGTGGVFALPAVGGDDGLTERALLVAPNPDPTDWFGDVVAASGGTLVVGTAFEASGSGGINGDDTDNSQFHAGAAYVFVQSGEDWVQQAYLKASVPEQQDRFGIALAIDGDTIVVGADEEDGGDSGINGDPSDNSLINSGAAYVFVRTGTTWTQQAYLKAEAAQAAAHFGSAVGISGDTIAVGARWEGASLGDDTGAVHVFTRSGTTWTQQARLQGSGLSLSNNFGEFLALDGDTLAVGVPRKSGPQPGQFSAGAGYIFARSGTTWTEQAVLYASNPGAGDRMGLAVALQGNTVVFGAPLESSAATIVNGDESDDSAPNAGAAYVFRRTGTLWNQEAYLKAPNAEAGDYFGTSIAVADGVALVGAMFESSAANEINGDMNDNSKNRAGAAYTYGWTGSEWVFRDYLKASNSGNSDNFGESVALSDGKALVGATGVDGLNQSLLAIGAATVFDDLQAAVTFCSAKTNSEGCMPSMSACGTPSVSPSASLLLQATLVTTKKNGLLFYGHAGSAALSFQGGTLCVQPPLRRTPIQSSGGFTFVPCDGTFSVDFSAWVLGGEDPLLAAGSTVNAQYWYRDPADADGSGLSNAAQFTLID